MATTRTGSIMTAALLCGLGSLSLAATPLPFADSFELYADGTAIPAQGAAWDATAPSGLVAQASAYGYAGAPPFPAATHEQVGELDDVARLPYSGTDGSRVYVQFLVKPVLGDTPKSVSAGATPEYAFHFNTDGRLVIFHTRQDLPNSTYETEWLEITTLTFSTSSWYRIQVCVDYLTGVETATNPDLYQKFFQISVNGVPVEHAIGLQNPKWYWPGAAFPSGDLGGSWFFSADFDDLAFGRGMSRPFAPGKAEGFGMEGFGRVDDLFVSTDTVVPSNTLSIASTAGGVTGTPAIPSTTSYPYGSNVSCSVDNPLTEIGLTTQLVCTGWTNGTGSIPPTGTGTTTVAVMNEDSGLTWTWTFRYYLDTEAASGGSVDVGDGWYDEGESVELKASPSGDQVFAGWSGDVPAADTNDNPLLLLMDRARTVTAVFSSDAGPQYTSRGTPHDWLSDYGVTGDFEAADTNDWDLDGSLTWQEYVAGTEPDDSNSVFELRSVSRAGASYRVEWYGTTNHGVTNPFVVLRRASVVDAGNWSTAATDIGRAPDGINTWSDGTPPGGKVFYRIEIPWP